jgi:hypothetical protein
VRQFFSRQLIQETIMKCVGLKFLIFVAGQIIIFGCGQKAEKLENRATDSVKVDKKIIEHLREPKISLDNFTEIPKEIEGCSCFYSESEEKNLKNEYLFVAGFDSTAFISIDNKLLKLKLVSTGREPHTFGDYDHTDIYTTNNYDIKLDIKYLKQEGDEGWLNTGTITIQSKDGLKETIKFFGGCGC